MNAHVHLNSLDNPSTFISATTGETISFNAWHHSQMTMREAIDLMDAGGHPYASPNMPHGFDTVLGYFFSCYGWYPAMYDDQEGNAMQRGSGMKEYDDWCAKYARLLGLEVREVEAPTALKVHGIMTLNAYPEALLEIRCVELP